MDRIQRILTFLQEIDKLKGIKRRSKIGCEDREETVAEHSWHLALFVFLFARELETEVDLEKVLLLALIHDLVEIYAGDTFAFDEEGQKDKGEREEEAARKLFSLLPADREEELHALWQEFESGQSKEALFTRALDKLQAVNENILSDGFVWRHYKVAKEKLLSRVKPELGFDPLLPEVFSRLLRIAVDRGYFPE